MCLQEGICPIHTTRWGSHFLRIFLFKWTVCRLKLNSVYFSAFQREKSQNPKSVISDQKTFLSMQIMKQVWAIKSRLNEVVEKSVPRLHDFNIYLKVCLRSSLGKIISVHNIFNNKNWADTNLRVLQVLSMFVSHQLGSSVNWWVRQNTLDSVNGLAGATTLAFANALIEKRQEGQKIKCSGFSF